MADSRTVPDQKGIDSDSRYSSKFITLVMEGLLRMKYRYITNEDDVRRNKMFLSAYLRRCV